MTAHRANIAPCDLIPHHGQMCLLNEIVDWDQDYVRCLADSHLSDNNPLRNLEGLSVIHALEYGAQAMAVHGGLLAREHGKEIGAGVVAAVRNARFHVERLDQISAPLIVTARQMLFDAGNMVYDIDITAQDQVIAEARLTVMSSGDKT